MMCCLHYINITYKQDLFLLDICLLYIKSTNNDTNLFMFNGLNYNIVISFKQNTNKLCVHLKIQEKVICLFI